MNPLQTLEQFGQAPWLDFVSRGLLQSGELTKLVQNDGLKGLTSNPSIFEKAIGHSKEYDDEIATLLKSGCGDVGTIFRQLAVGDIRAAADALAPVYEATKAADGYVSLEVSPYIARDTKATIAEAHELWSAVARDNLMIKVPGTPQGVPAIRQLIADGLNINVTLLFSRDAYNQVAEAYIAGLEALPPSADLSRSASVASFFVSRIDAKIDGEIGEKLKTASGTDRARLESLLGKVAIANAKLAYQDFERLFSGPRWDALAKRGARVQRLLWASTGTKNKAYSDVLYVDTLIGPETVNTLPPDTLAAFRDHGKPQNSLQADVPGAEKILADLKAAGISLDATTDWLVEDGVDKFADAADQLYGAIAEKCDVLSGQKVKIDYNLGGAGAAVDAAVKAWSKAGDVRRLWEKDATLWSGKDEAKWLGWLDVPTRERAGLPALQDFAGRVRSKGWSDVVLLGMGGSSLGSEVLRETFGQQAGAPRFHILDSTDPDEIGSLDEKIALATTLFIVASKSGSTLEPNIFKDYYFDRVASAIGKDRAGGAFRRHHRSRLRDGEIGRAGRLRRCISRRCDHRRALFGAVEFRTGSRRRHGDRRQAPSRRGLLDAVRLRSADAARRQSRRETRDCAWHAGRQERSRQTYRRGVQGTCELWGLAGATGCGVDRQTRQRLDPGRCANRSAMSTLMAPTASSSRCA